MMKLTYGFLSLLLLLNCSKPQAFLSEVGTRASAIRLDKLGFISGAGTEYTLSYAIESDGSFYMSGVFTDTIEFQGIQFTPQGTGDHFVAKFDSNLRVIWAKSFSGTGSEGVGRIALSKRGDLYNAFAFSGQLPIGDTTVETPDGLNDLMLVKLDSSTGETLWHKHITGEGVEEVHHIWAANDGSLHVAGNYLTEATFETTCAGYTYRNGFYARLDLDGNYETVSCITDATAQTKFHNVMVSEEGEVYLSGFITETAKFNDYLLSTKSSTANGFILKLNSQDEVQYAHILSSDDASTAYAMVEDGSGGVYLTGNITNQVTFGDLTITTTNTNRDLYLTYLDAVGKPQWIVSYGGNATDYGLGIDYSADHGVIVGGYHHSSASFNIGDFDLNGSGSATPYFIVFNHAGVPKYAKSIYTTGTGYAWEVHALGDKIYFLGSTNHGSGDFDGTSYSTSGQDIFLSTFNL